MEVKEKVTVRFSAIDRAMVKYDPENMRLSSEWGGGGGSTMETGHPQDGGGGGGGGGREQWHSILCDEVCVV